MVEDQTWKWGINLAKKTNQVIRKSSRYLAMETLEKIEKQQAYSNLAINDMIEKNSLSRPDANLYTELVYGVTQRRYTLDYYLSPYLKKQKKIENWVKQLLRLSIYQAEFLDRIPDFAIIDEAVEIAKERGHKGTSSLVNGVLRNYQRKGHPDIEDISDPVEQFSIKYSVNKSLTGILIEENGAERANSIAASLLERSKASARINRRYTTRDAVILQSVESDIELTKSDLSTDGVVANKGHLSELPAFKKGEITIQDESSMLVAEVMAVEPDHLVLDACAAPGGKTTHIANFVNSDLGGKVYSSDLHPHKVKLIDENVNRQGFEDVVETSVLDAKKAGAVYEANTFDRILIDAPCSGIGLTRRKPDIKYTKTAEDIEHLQKVQLDILNSVADLVKPSGILTYSTCTIIDKENQDVIQAFLATHDDFKLRRISLDDSKVEINEEGYIAIKPDSYGTDGFFIVNLEKI